MCWLFLMFSEGFKFDIIWVIILNGGEREGFEIGKFFNLDLLIVLGYFVFLLM